MSVKSASTEGLTRANSSNFRSIRVEQGALIRRLRRRYTLWLHGWWMGLITLGLMWGVAALQRHGGVDSLAVRYAVTLGVGYLCYLLLLRLWAGMLVREEERGIDDPGIDLSWPDGGGAPDGGGLHSGGGGDFGGGGADGGFDAVGDTAESLLGDAASGALDGLGAADEGAIVIIPVLAVFGAVLAALLGAGWLLLLYFGSEALLAAAVELAFAYTAARTAVRVEREGWLLAAIRLSWKPLLGALVCAVALGALIDHFVPQAESLPDAVRLWRAR
ncbi:hypothetical protein [Ottowia testudinis]|uniref:Uncharacterized protein n=1 Tax=Ottowia testudinis TaxID=2816950 RepID=A0A975CH90_9BURK|nr:hypothetical protein [Ottowia testudinis]QTD45771.1 hypothetical protein J1M35_02295 [Ottowia testudinis]